MPEVGMEEHIRYRLPPMERIGGDVMQTTDGIQINSRPLQDSGKQVNNNVCYQQIACHCR